MAIERSKKIIVPTNDYVFKRIFGHVGNEKITKGLVSTIIGREITSITLDHNPNLEKNTEEEKSGSLDIRATIDFEYPCNIEMQLKKDKTIEKRLLFYWSYLYSKNIKSGEDHADLKKTISILIADFELESLSQIHNYHTEWNIREKNYSKVVLTNDLEFHILELPKLRKAIDNNAVSKEDKRLALWGKFFINPDELEDDEVVDEEELKLAQKVLDDLRKNENEIEKAQDTIMNAMRQEGILEAALDDTKIKIAKELLKIGLSIEEIMQATELSKEEIEKLI